jgi:hypothetical protein
MKPLVSKLRRRLSQAVTGTWVPPGHFYSPIPDLDEVRQRDATIFQSPGSLPGIDLNDHGQLDLLRALRRYYADMPGLPHKRPGFRFAFENPAYSLSDALFLFCMIRHLRPRRIIEVGSGHSSCLMLDTNELFFQNAISCTFVEPYPGLLRSLIRADDEERIEIVSRKVQDVPLGRFAALEAGDILFIDSTHVSKVGSDVNYLLFEVLPALQSGVAIHIHDVFYPFEYSRDWVYEGRSWNEAYLLRAFLQYNRAFRVELFNTYLNAFHEQEFRQDMPEAILRHGIGASIWLRKV